MLDKYNRIKNKFDEGDSIINSAVTNIENATAEMKKQNDDLINNVSNINIIISDIDKQFSEKTGITNVKDMSFLWGAVAIQCVRWLLIENIDEKALTPDPSNRKDSGSEGKKDKCKW